MHSTQHALHSYWQQYTANNIQYTPNREQYTVEFIKCKYNSKQYKTNRVHQKLCNWLYIQYTVKYKKKL